MKNTAIPAVLLAAFLGAACAGAPGATQAPQFTPSSTPAGIAPTPTAAPTPTVQPATAGPTETADSTAEPTSAVTATPSRPTSCSAAANEISVAVASKANIFGAGHGTAPDPGGGGGGIRPPVVELPAGPDLAVTFPCVSGRINCCFGTPDTPASGTTSYTTDIDSHVGISGIIHGGRSVFLVGVFLGDREPKDPAPERLDFTTTCPETCTFPRLEPELGQTFFIGEGGETPEYVAPEGATRLFLGIADAFYAHGQPGWYDNNKGRFEVILRLP